MNKEQKKIAKVFNEAYSKVKLTSNKMLIRNIALGIAKIMFDNPIDREIFMEMAIYSVKDW